MRSWDYTHEKLWATVTLLAGRNGTVQERLANAYVSQLMRLTTDDMPLDMRDAFVELRQRLMAKAPDGYEDRVSATTATMDDTEAERIATAIVTMYGEVCKRMGDGGTQ